MPKLKTAKAILKRIERSANGSLRGRKMSIAHRSRFKSKRALGAVDSKQTLSRGMQKKIKKILTI